MRFPGGCSGLGASVEQPLWMAYRDSVYPNRAAYGELTVHNASHATWRPKHALDQAVIDEFAIVQRNHGQFPKAMPEGDDGDAAEGEAGVMMRSVGL
jgi:hypothetical protein